MHTDHQELIGYGAKAILRRVMGNVMPNREVRLGCLFLSEIGQAKMVSFVVEWGKMIGDRKS